MPRAQKSPSGVRRIATIALIACALAAAGASTATAAPTARFASGIRTLVFTSDPGPNPDPHQAAYARTVCVTQHTPNPCPPGSIVFGHPAEAHTADLSSIPGAAWIWANVSPFDLSDLASYWFVTTVDAPPSPRFGSLSISADDFARVFVNGTELGSVGSTTNVFESSAHAELTKFDLSPVMRSGRNLIVVNAQNGPAGFSPFCSGPCNYRENPASVVFGGRIGTGIAPVLADHPVGYWRFDEPAGKTAFDNVSNNDGTYNTGFTLGRPGIFADDTAVTLDGVSGYVKIPDVPALRTGDNFSLEAWVKRDYLSTSVGTEGLFAKQYQLYLDVGRLVLRKPFEGQIARSTVAIADRAFHHVVATKSGPSVHLYVDGVDVTGPVTNRTIVDSGGSALLIGAGANTFRGTLDEAAVYDYALTPAQVAAHFAAGH